ncbi:cupin domain-containing protein [Nocardioides alcanivorans]|uniref:cupin domain-containing protein n=1 Tax=Nocardioides alcanivorans TaxID=2897352 RepID=UPI001F1CBDB9|nr:cupin domain-containing protein [Nocardioides alcanivorans]
MNQGYDRGWSRYSFGDASMGAVNAHAADIAICARGVINRGPGRLQMSILELPADSSGDAIGLHMHRDVFSGREVEEFYIVISGRCRMSFTNGDEVDLGPGDVAVTYPGTGHAVRVVGRDPVRLVVMLPEGFRTARTALAADTDLPEFSPQVTVLDVDPAQMTPLRARCAGCGALWSQESAGIALPEWARIHACCA